MNHALWTSRRVAPAFLPMTFDGGQCLQLAWRPASVARRRGLPAAAVVTRSLREPFSS